MHSHPQPRRSSPLRSGRGAGADALRPPPANTPRRFPRPAAAELRYAGAGGREQLRTAAPARPAMGKSRLFDAGEMANFKYVINMAPKALVSDRKSVV